MLFVLGGLFLLAVFFYGTDKMPGKEPADRPAEIADDQYKGINESKNLEQNPVRLSGKLDKEYRKFQAEKGRDKISAVLQSAGDNKSGNVKTQEKLDTTSVFVPADRYEFEPVVEGTEITHNFIIQNKGKGILNINRIRSG